MEINCDTAVEASCFDDLVINFFTELPLVDEADLRRAKAQFNDMCGNIEYLIARHFEPYGGWRVLVERSCTPLEEETR